MKTIKFSMSTTPQKNVKLVQDFLLAKGLSTPVKVLFNSTKTAKDAADNIGCSISQIAKSLVFVDKERNRPILVVASGSNRVDVKKIKQRTGLDLKKADAAYVVEKVGFVIGGVPPIAHKEKLTTLLDIDIKQYNIVWAAAGTPFAVFPLTPTDLENLTDGLWLELSE